MVRVMRVDPVRLRATGPAFDMLSSRVAQTWRRLTDVLGAEGACWGGDQAGAAFAGSYVLPAQRVCDSFAYLRDSVGDIGGTLLQVADAADAAESRARQRLA